MMLLEREPVLASLRQYAHEASQGEGRLVLIAGEAGAGKSVLVERFQRDLPDAIWSWGACDGLSTPHPLAPLFDLARDLGGTLEDLCRGQPERDELFAALLTQVTGDDRLNVIVIEDIHWADEATLDLMRFLTRRIRAASVLVIATYRGDWLAPSSPLRLALGELAARRWARRLELPPLSVEAVRTMAAGTGLDADQLYRLTGGNPFYVTEMLEAGTHGVPLSARDATLSRTGRLSDTARQVLETAALMGVRIDAGLLADRQSELDELSASGLLVDEGIGLRFRHEIARLAIAQEIPAHRQALIHARILNALRPAAAAMTRAWPSTLRVLATKKQSSGTHLSPRDEPLISAHIARLRPSTSAHCDGPRIPRRPLRPSSTRALPKRRLSATNRKPRPTPTSRRSGSGGCSKIAVMRASRCSATR